MSHRVMVSKIQSKFGALFSEIFNDVAWIMTIAENAEESSQNFSRQIGSFKNRFTTSCKITNISPDHSWPPSNCTKLRNALNYTSCFHFTNVILSN